MRNLILAFKLLRRDVRAGELGLIGVALLIAIVSLTSVGFFTDSLRQGLLRDANQLIGGDVLLVGDKPLAPELRRQAEADGLQAVNSIVFNSMATSDEAAQLSTLKAVEEGYPLRGSLRVADTVGGLGEEAGRVPARGEVWVEARILSTLGLKLGDSLQLGTQPFRIGKILTYESDRGSNFINFVPRLIMNLADVPGTELLQAGSRARYRLQLAGERAAGLRYEAWLQDKLERGVRMESLDNARPELRENLDRVTRFLQLAAMLSVVLAAVAMGLSSRRYLRRHLDACAVMRCFGAQRKQLLAIYGLAFTIFALVLALLGGLIGFAAQAVLAKIAAGLVAADLPAPGYLPALHGLLVALVLTLGFVLPQLLQLVRVPPVRVLRREWDAPGLAATSAWGAGIVGLAALMLWIAHDIKLGATIVGGFALACMVFALLARGLLWLLARSQFGQSAWGLRYGLAAMHRRLASSIVQSVGLALGLTAVLLLSLVTQDLLGSWKNNQSADAPNQFVLNIQPDQIEALKGYFSDNKMTTPDLLPMVRGRLMKINGREVSAKDYSEERARDLVERETNLSWSTQLQEGNSVVAGRWFGDVLPGAALENQFSIEEGIGKKLGIKLNDVITFNVAGQSLEGRVTSLRRLNWDSMRVNFFFIAEPGMMDNYPATYITSFRAPGGQTEFINQMLARFPNLTAIDVGAVIAQIVDITHKLVSAVNFVFAFALGAGVVVLLAALQATHDERIHELAVLRTMGARNRQLRLAMLAEFAVLGVLASTLAVAAALAIGYIVSYYVLELPYQANWLALVSFFLVASLAVVLAGWLGVRGLLKRSVVDGLRAFA